MRRVAVLLLVALLVVPAPALASVRGSPDLSLSVADNRVEAGEVATLGVTVTNAGDLDDGSARSPQLESRVTTARGVTLEMRSGGAPITVRSGPVAIGNLPEGAVGPARDPDLNFRVAVEENAEPGTYRVPVDVEYTYTSTIAEESGARNEQTVEETLHVTIVIEDSARFRVVDASTTAAVGGAGTVRLELRNVGNEVARDASVSVASTSTDLQFGEAGSAESFAGTWAPGETRVLTYATSVASGATRRPLPLEATVAFEDAEGFPRTDSLSTGVTPVADQQFVVESAESAAAVGDSGSLSVTLRNTGGEALRDVTVQLQSSNAALTFGGSPTARAFADSWAPGETRTFSVEHSLAPGAESRSYAVDATVSYTGAGGQSARARAVTFGVTPAASQVVVESAESAAAVGDSGSLSVTLRNTGDRTLESASVQLQSGNAALTFGGSPTARAFVGSWAPGETRNLTVEATFAPGAETRSYAVDATVSYVSPSGQSAQARPVTLGVTPADEQAFDVRDANATLRVGEEGRIGGTLVNEGPGEVENAVLILQPTGSSIGVVETEYAIGDLSAGDSASFGYELDVSSEARDGPRQFTYRLQYEDEDGSTVQSDPLYVQADVAPKRQVFTVEPANATVDAGGSATFSVELTNNGDQRLTDISAKLFADDPISVADDEAFVDALEPGETTTVEFRVSAAGGVLTKAYPVSMDVQYDEPDGDTKLSDTYRVPVEVVESEGGGILPFGLAGGALVFALGVAGVVGGVYRFRR